MPLTPLRKLINILIIIATIGYIARPPGAIGDPAAIVVTDACRSAMDGLSAIHKRPGGYFEVFTHLKITPGYTLDYVYHDGGLGGEPLVYARESNSEPLENEAALGSTYNGQFPSKLSWPLLQYAYRYIDKIQPDQSPESYFEFVALALLGSQFSLQWHALYNDIKIVCDPSDIESIRSQLDPRTLSMWPFMHFDWAFNINLQPVVLIAEKTVTVRIVTFTKWGGFFEKIYTLDKQNPANVIDFQSKQLVQYECFWNF